MHHCPNCGSRNIYRSTARSLLDRLWKSVSRRRPHRCQACGWRGWGMPTGGGGAGEWTAPADVPDFEALDAALRAGPRALDRESGARQTGTRTSDRDDAAARLNA